VVVGVGVDVVEVERVERALRRWGEAFLARVYTPSERKRAGGRAGVARLAARFAAKEAVMKALGVGWGRLRFSDIEIVSDGNGRPVARLHGGAAQVARAAGVDEVYLSLSHARGYAAAVAVAEARR
jgi:holo-[acyl-carrier protein] synthase